MYVLIVTLPVIIVICQYEASYIYFNNDCCNDWSMGPSHSINQQGKYEI